MRNLYFLLAGCLLHFSCGDKDSQNTPANEVPKPLQDNASGYGSLSKRGYNEDLVTALYNERLEADTALKNLEEQITSLQEDKADSLAAFNKFDNKNKSYYESADSHAGLIKDSLLRSRILTTVVNSLIQYNQGTAAHTALLNRIASGEASLSDLHQALKVVHTLPLIKQYQKGSMPSTGPLAGFTNRLSKAVQTADTLLKK